jgi:predicted lipoprotein with Yx(FWY)xxD motif
MEIRLFAGGFLLGICCTTVAMADTPEVATADPGAMPTVVATRPVPAGTVLADVTGKTLYSSDRDKAGKSACDSDCSQTWQPLPAAWMAKPAGDWSVVEREDGNRQWAYKGKPLYTYAGDNKAGDTNGDGADKSWHAVVMTRKFLPNDVAIWKSDFGPAFRTTDGKTLYVLAELRFNPLGTKRHNGPNIGLDTCKDDCLKTWHPLTAPADAKGAEDWSVVTRPDGRKQWAYKDWPVFTNVADSKAGDAQGEGVTAILDGQSGLSWQVATLPQS